MSAGPAAHDLVRTLGELPSPPEVYGQLTVELERPEWTPARIARIIGVDAGVTARVLRMVNSPYYGVGREVATVEEAVMLLGAEEVRGLVLATSVVESFRGVPPELVNMDDFFRRSAHAAVTCARVAVRATARMDPARAFLGGLLHDVGSIVVCLMLPEAARSALLHELHDSSDPLLTIERAVMESDEAVVGGELLTSWRLPEAVSAAVRWHVHPEGAEIHGGPAAIVHLGSRLSIGFSEGITDAGGIVPETSPAWALAGLTPQNCEGLVDEIENAYAETAALLR
ncbi:HDOD domain-containing protein [Arhodomonas aquaeolei]|uniref:HDOD domain-containing protein n=1 Tax=Arhodomonas aquaeolei TaxID=2369 RepID=UPI00037B9828|nr:HDOD domain-containing protein [Arhodomonas aquaeolei]